MGVYEYRVQSVAFGCRLECRVLGGLEENLEVAENNLPGGPGRPGKIPEHHMPVKR